ncbi:mandelate racemase/muconate lactonizing enzyme family protein [bacterium]|nr:mandelate racemase/muconate lactonizing enzyme family protein [bacterium]
MASNRDIRIERLSLYYLPVQTRVPLKFGPETTTHAICARVRVEVSSRSGTRAEGWGETPLSVAWVWPGDLSFESRLAAMQEFCGHLAAALSDFPVWGHPMEIVHRFLQDLLPPLFSEFNAARSGKALPEMPWLAALVCLASFDLALFDAYGELHGAPVFSLLGDAFLNHDLAWFYGPGEGARFAGLYPDAFLASPAPLSLPAWHLVGGKDLLTEAELTGAEPKDGYPVVLADWIDRDGLSCLKIKLTGVDAAWDYERTKAVGRLAAARGARWLSVDFNCTVRDPAYVCDILDRLLAEEPAIYAMILYVEQPFPYDLERNQIDVHSVSARKPLFMDESAHDWKFLAMGRALGWTGVALKTCKTLTGALLSLCWAKTKGMTLMVQDLTNPMLAQIPHVQLAAHAGTIMGVETNSMQFYPDASLPEARVHPGLFTRVGGRVRLDSLGPTGFGYRVREIGRVLPAPAWEGGRA